ncbi:lipid II:glycine glycyltransferase FemX [Furfurilactobacillus siliginis]|uniref:Methicillin resistance protein n=1 Tax=Furfurilactobacillus siliginis TaxID=348151 RepID=A0A0R2L0V4_9LACO|nr:peptidoglycan bridge formation glycyltransferase FemA/FemB family protein [Furfurilactobacillus siliginis]KRN95072.1 Methicillin resistance protein [Furfurilactobacillus siliginis]GEK28328.1 methicillin resistance protein [Furfurilactobacillus siliginis]
MPVINEQDSASMDRYVDFVRNAPYTSVTQDPGWGAIKNNWEPLHVTVERDGEIVAAMSILMIANEDGKKLAYCSKGPVCDPTDVDLIDALVAEAEPALRENNVYVLRMDPETIYSEDLSQKFTDHGYQVRNRNVGMHDTIQPRFNMVMDLAGKSLDDVLMTFRPNTRHDVRHSIKPELTVDAGNDMDEMDRFYALYEEMSHRQGITYRPRDYFDRMVSAFAGTDILRIFIAKSETQDLAGALAFKYGDKLWYMYGGSINAEPKLLAPYRLQWEMINEAVGAKKDRYDLGGVFALDKSDGLWLFKHGYVRDATEYLGEIDKVYDAEAYAKFTQQ